jgi:hypothetical protein
LALAATSARYAQTNVGGAAALKPDDGKGTLFIAGEAGLQHDYRHTVRLSAGVGGQMALLSVRGRDYAAWLPLSAGIEVTAFRLQPWFVRGVAKVYGGGSVDEEPTFRLDDRAAGGFLGVDFYRLAVERKDHRAGGEVGYGLLVGAFLVRAVPDGQPSS